MFQRTERARGRFPAGVDALREFRNGGWRRDRHDLGIVRIRNAHAYQLLVQPCRNWQGSEFGQLVRCLGQSPRQQARYGDSQVSMLTHQQQELWAGDRQERRVVFSGDR